MNANGTFRGNVIDNNIWDYGCNTQEKLQNTQHTILNTQMDFFIKKFFYGIQFFCYNF